MKAIQVKFDEEIDRKYREGYANAPAELHRETIEWSAQGCD